MGALITSSSAGFKRIDMPDETAVALADACSDHLARHNGFMIRLVDEHGKPIELTWVSAGQTLTFSLDGNGDYSDLKSLTDSTISCLESFNAVEIVSLAGL